MFGLWKTKAKVGKANEVGDDIVSKPIQRRPLTSSYSNVSGGKIMGLRDVDLDTLFSLTPIKLLKPDTHLFKRGDSVQAIHLVVKGEVELQAGTGATVIKVSAGDWIGSLDFGSSGPYPWSAVARGPASVLTISREVFDEIGISENLGLRLLTQMYLREQCRMPLLTKRSEELEARNQTLEEALYHSQVAADTRFSRSETVGQVIQKVVRLPVSSATLLHKLFDENSTHAEVVELVKSDPSLASTLLKAINSPLYALQHEIDNVDHAVTLLGFDGVHQLVLSESLRKSLPETPRFQEIYHRALETSRLAFAVAQSTGMGPPAELSTIGLLHELGNVVLELLKSQNTRLEGLLATMDSAGLGAELLRAWNLPERLCKTVEFQRYPEFSLPKNVPIDVLKSVAILYMANRFQRRIQADANNEGDPFVREYLDVLGLTGVSETSFFAQQVKPKLLAHKQTLPRNFANTLSS